MTLVVENSSREELVSNFLSCPLDFVHKNFSFSQEDYDYLRAQRISRMWMSSKRCQIQGEGVSPPHLWKIAENKQNIVTGHLEHERRLKSNNKLNGTRHLDEWGRELLCDISKQTPSRVEAGVGK